MDGNAPASPLKRLRSLWVLGASVLFLLADFAIVAVPWYWERAPADLRPALVGASVRVEGWPPAESVFIVTGPAAPRLVRVDSGSFEDWELPLASRIHTILDVRVSGSLDVHGLWSPLWVSHGHTMTVTNMSTGQPASDEQRALAASVYGADLIARGYERRWVEPMMADGEVHTLRISWAGVANEVMVLLALCAGAVSLGAIGDARVSRRARLLAAGICPWCKYHVAEMDRCPECGRILRRRDG